MTDTPQQSDSDASPWTSPQADASAPFRKPAPLSKGPPPRGLTRYLVLCWLCGAAIIAYICRNSLGVAEKDISEEFGLTDPQMGMAMSAFFLTYALFSIPSGQLGQRLGTRRMLPLIAVLWSLATLAMAASIGLWSLIATRMAGGVAQTGLFPSCTGTVGRWFPRSEKAIASGALGSFMSVGGAIGAGATGLLLLYLNWRIVFGIYGLLGLVWAFLFYAWFRDRPEDHQQVSQGERDYIRGVETPQEVLQPKQAATHPATELPEPTPWSILLTSPAMWLISAQQFCRAAAYIFFASWFPKFLQETQDVSQAVSGVLTMVPLLAVVVGGLSGGILSDTVLARTGSVRLARCGISAVAMLSAAACFLSAFWITNLAAVVTVIGMGTFFGSIGGPCAYAVTIDIGGNHVPTVFSKMNMWGNLGAVIFPYLAPLFVTMTGGDWINVLPLCAFIYFIAAVSWLLLRPDGSIFDQASSSPPSQESA